MGYQSSSTILWMRAEPKNTISPVFVAVAPCAEHVLDWFHLTMRLTVLGQYARGTGPP